jgi:hypothetical protein
MNDLSLALQMVIIELGVLIVVLLVILLLAFGRRYRSHRSTARTLVRRLNEDRASRQVHRRELLGRLCDLADEDMEERVRELVRRENTLFSRVLNAIGGEDSSGLLRMDEDLQALLAAYMEQVSAGVEDKAREQEAAVRKLREDLTKLSGLYRELKGENQELREQLEGVTREYNALYEREQARRQEG